MQVAGEDCRRLAMLKEEACRRSMAQAPSNANAWEIGLFCAVCVCESRATFPATRLGG